MELRDDQIDALLKMLSLTRSGELGCDECAEHLAELIEMKLGGLSVPESLKAIEQHLEMCSDCAEEFESLRRALESQG